MKKLLSFLAVAAIVTSAFAFKTMGLGNFCVRDDATNKCKILHAHYIDNASGSEFFHYPLSSTQWDGTLAGCTGASITTDCVNSIKLISN